MGIWVGVQGHGSGTDRSGELSPSDGIQSTWTWVCGPHTTNHTLLLNPLTFIGRHVATYAYKQYHRQNSNDDGNDAGHVRLEGNPEGARGSNSTIHGL